MQYPVKSMKKDAAPWTSTAARWLAALLAMGLCTACGGGSGSAQVPGLATPAAPEVPAPTATTTCTDESDARTLAVVDASITIDASTDQGTATPLIGFNHGIAAPSGPDYNFPAQTSSHIAALKPSIWRVSDSRHYLKAKSYGAQTIYVASDTYFNYQPIYYPWNDTGTASGTFDDWHNFDANAVGVLQVSLTQAQPVDYWNVMNEPQFNKYSATDQQRLMATFKHGYQDFKNGHPEQKVAGPSTIGYNPLVMQPLLDSAVTNALYFEAITWHENGTHPEDVVAHVDNLRSLLAARPSLGSPPVIIEEYASAEQHHLPGFAVAWFYYLEQAGVLHAARACWNMTDATNGLWSDCWNGLNGLFMKDNLSPQPLYWVFERYAQMLGRKLSTTSSAPSDVVALARSTATNAAVAGETKVLIGRFASDNTQARAATRKIAIALQGLPAATGCVVVDIARIPFTGPDLLNGSDPIAQPLVAPEVVDHYSAQVVGGKVTAFLPAFRDRDAYYISVK